MITIGGTRQPSALYKGVTPVKAVYRGDDLIWQSVKTYGGIEAMYDNAFYRNNGSIDSIITDNGYFVSKKIPYINAMQSFSMTYGYTRSISYPYTHSLRLFTNNKVESIDYWNVSSSVKTSIMIAAEYIVISIFKDAAPYFYAYDNTHELYLLKGDDV